MDGFIPSPRGPRSVNISQSAVRNAVHAQMQIGAEAFRKAGVGATFADCTLAGGILVDRREHALKDPRQIAAHRESWKRGHGRHFADAASTVPEANTWVPGAPLAPLIRPSVLMQNMPSVAVPIWTDVVRLDFFEFEGSVSWGRGGGENAFGRASYTVNSQWLLTPHIVWTVVERDMRQQQLATSPNYLFDPAAMNMEAAMTLLDLALEDAIVDQPPGVQMPTLRTTFKLQRASDVVYGEDPVETALSDFIKQLQTISELTLDKIKPDTCFLTSRILNGIYRQLTTTGGFPIDPIAWLQSALKQYGITRVIVAPKLQDYGGTNIDAMVLVDSGPNGLKRWFAMEPTVVKTVQGLTADQTLVAAMPAGLLARYRSSTLVVEVEVVPAA